MSAVRDKFVAMRRDLNASLIEREGEVDLALTAMLCREHVLLVGPPGTAKSLLADSLAAWLGDPQDRFHILLTKFTAPEELFGMFDLSKFKAGQYERIMDDMLPTVSIAVLDEIWKSSSAVLNTLLRVLNERQVKNGRAMVKCPLACAIAASNEYPTTESAQELNAMFDRLLFRKTIRPVATLKGRRRLMWERDHTPKLSTTITPAELHAAHAEVQAIPFEDAARDALNSIIDECVKEGIVPGDRRCYKAVTAAQGYAYLSGSDVVKPDHLEILSHVLWTDPVDQPKKCETIVGRLANPIGMKINGMMMEAQCLIDGLNPADLGAVTTAVSKLSVIHRQLGEIGGNGRAKAAQTDLGDDIKQLRLKALELV